MGDKDFSIGEVKELSAVVADRLVEMIESGVFKPGTRLVQTDLAQQFGVSRVAIRDALHRLVQKKLAVKIPRKGVIVCPLSSKTISDIIKARRVLEIVAAKEACAKMTDEALHDLEQIIEEQEALAQEVQGKRGDLSFPLKRLIQKDWEFHMSLYGHCDNEILKEIVADLWTRMRQAQGLAQVNVEWGEKWMQKSATFHRRLLNALHRRDADRVGQLLSRAFDRVEKELIEALQSSRGAEEQSRKGA